MKRTGKVDIATATTGTAHPVLSQTMRREIQTTGGQLWRTETKGESMFMRCLERPHGKPRVNARIEASIRPVAPRKSVVAISVHICVVAAIWQRREKTRHGAGTRIAARLMLSRDQIARSARNGMSESGARAYDFVPFLILQ